MHKLLTTNFSFKYNALVVKEIVHSNLLVRQQVPLNYNYKTNVQKYLNLCDAPYVKMRQEEVGKNRQYSLS